MNVSVLGLWHLGTVTAACLARAGHHVVGWDPDADVVKALASGKPPIAEPGLDALVGDQIRAGRLTFDIDVSRAVHSADVVWIAFDTPVDDEDRADVDAVLSHVRTALPFVRSGAVVVCSSQLPVGTVGRLEREFLERGGDPSIGFACIPENLQLGKAIERFLEPDRIVAGTRSERGREVLSGLIASLTDRVEWMSVESAEMTKHAINAFLATSVAFINELAVIGEAVGADAKDVERGLKSDRRIGPAAYLSPGAAFSGGTLARDLVLLETKAGEATLPSTIVSAVLTSNRKHRAWAERTLTHLWPSLADRRIAVWGLTYKPGTDTLRRSASVEMCIALRRAGARVRAFDPAVTRLPSSLDDVLALGESALAAVEGADALVVATAWPDFRRISADDLVAAMPGAPVLDAGRFLDATLGRDARVRYFAVGTPRS